MIMAAVIVAIIISVARVSGERIWFGNVIQIVAFHLGLYDT